MPDSIKKAARWLGLVEDSRYDYDEVDGELTEEVFSDADYEPSQVTPLPEIGTDPERAGFRFDTSLRGNANGGHLYGTQLSRAERDAILEYLKPR